MFELEVPKSEIIGRKIIKIYEDYQHGDGFDMAFYTFELDSGVIFSLPYDGRPPIQVTTLKPNKIDITKKLVSPIDGVRIKNVYLDATALNNDLSLAEVENVVFELESDLWLSNQSSAPHGVEHTIGIYIELGQDFDIDKHNLLDFWCG